jgi:hypothetical protein
MSRRERDRLLIAALTAAFVVASGAGRHLSRATSARDPLPSWTDDATKRLITSFVARVTNASGTEFVPAADRIAVFDNDGTLWCEQPMYVELAFSFARVGTLVQAHPELRDRQPYKAVIERDTQALAAAGQKGISEIVVATHSGMTTTQFDTTVIRWLATARHPLRAALHRARVRADARAVGLSSRERLPDLRRLGRRRGLHARLGAEDLRRRAGADHRQHREGRL